MEKEKSDVDSLEFLGNEATRNENNSDDNEDIIQVQNKRNPLEISPVIRCVLQYLNVEDIKKCRYLNTEWGSVGLLVLKTRAKILFTKDHSCLQKFERTPSQFLEVFPERLETAGFTAFKILGNDSLWCVNELTNFFQSYQQHIMELELENLSLVDDDGKPIKNFDITPWISNSAMSKPKRKYDTKLSICSSLITISFSSLGNVKKLLLEHCQVNLEDGLQISPVLLELIEVNFYKNGNKLPNICINDIVNLSNIRRVQLDCSDDDDDMISTILSVDLGTHDGLTLEYLYIDDTVDILNWKDCTWTVERLILHGVSFIERTQMQIKKLYFYGSAFDFSVLPQTVETLLVYSSSSQKDSCSVSQTVILPNLKSVGLKLHNDDLISISPHLANCPIVEISFLGRNSVFRVDLGLIPRSVRRLQLENVELNLTENSDVALNLEKLVLKARPSTMVNNLKIICTTQTKMKQLVLSSRFKIKERGAIFRQVLDHIDSQQCFYVGRFECDQNYVDQMEWKYYVFENQKVNHIHEDEFLELERVITLQ